MALCSGTTEDHVAIAGYTTGDLYADNSGRKMNDRTDFLFRELIIREVRGLIATTCGFRTVLYPPPQPTLRTP